MVKEAEFPKWEGHKDLEEMKKLISSGCYNDPKQILEYAAKMAIEWAYFKDMLLFLQHRIQKHIENGEGLGVGIDSSKEIFEGLMLVPAEDVVFPEDDINDHEQFIRDMKKAGIKYEDYRGRFFYHGPAVRTDEKGFPTRQDVIRATNVRLQWDNLGSDYIAYPMQGNLEIDDMDNTDNKKNKVNFYDIVNNPDYYDMTEDGKGKDFFVCADCGYIPKSKIDTEQIKFLDMHCKCGCPAVLATFSLEELYVMINDKIESERYGMLCEAELRKAFGK